MWTRLINMGTRIGKIVLCATALMGGVVPVSQNAHADLDHTLCPIIADSGSNFAATASTLTNATSSLTGKTAPPPEITKFFTHLALSSYCPLAVTNITDGHLPPGLSGLAGMLGLPQSLDEITDREMH